MRIYSLTISRDRRIRNHLYTVGTFYIDGMAQNALNRTATEVLQNDRAGPGAIP